MWFAYCYLNLVSVVSEHLTVSRVCEANQVSEIGVSLCWLAYLAAMRMKSKLPQAWFTYSSREINQITGGGDPLRGLNLENCESEPYTNDAILRIPLYCNFFDDRCTWLKDFCFAGMKL